MTEKEKSAHVDIFLSSGQLRNDPPQSQHRGYTVYKHSVQSIQTGFTDVDVILNQF